MIKIGFLLLSILMIVSPIVFFLKSPEKNKLTRNYLLIITIWMIYILGLSFSGVLKSFDLPPRVPLLIIIPSIILSVWLTGQSIFKRNLSVFSQTFPVFIQAFRVGVEMLIFGAILYGFFPAGVSFDGTNYDIIVGISALFTGFLMVKNFIGKKGVLAWNIISLVILTGTGLTFVATYYLTDNFPEEVNRANLTEFPFVLLPGILLPFAIFYHVVSIRQSLLKG
ncbi:hypothetical protein [Marinigracilibium pacificum]|uniref:Uncharacterized protein n=1 Tax=Marinigracilibium pacificum TaxID=2729599 RepID=A0A848J8R3_9BACT|nr:hypothetical protein [Marinigracilibium pacificum]NMM50880.1 hypothetical protein [Marinigracilibium pacificum]